MTEDLRPDPVAAAIIEHAHCVGHHLARIDSQLARVYDQLQRVGDLLADLNTRERQP